MVFDIAILICEHRRATHIERFADVFSFKLLAGQRWSPLKTSMLGSSIPGPVLGSTTVIGGAAIGNQRD
jgi:hypothetical protein